VASGEPVTSFTAERNARIFDPLAEEIGEAAAVLRATR
jgi:hypothetical protein